MEKKPSLVLKTLFIVLFDVIGIILAGGIALLVRFDFSIDAVPDVYLEGWYHFLPLKLGVTIVLFFLLHMYHFVWRTIGMRDVLYMVLCTTFAFTQTTLASIYLGNRQLYNVIFMQLVFELFILVGGRCLLRFWEALRPTLRRMSGEYDQRILLVGAGEAGRVIAHELLSSRKINAKLCAVVDDNANKWGKYLDGVPIIGGRGAIPSAVTERNITQIIVAIPSASPQQRSDILNICNATGVRTRALPSVLQLVGGDASLSNVRDVQVEDLLARAPVRFHAAAVDGLLRGRSVMVMGGGSIGSELCRQIAAREPKSLCIVDIYENNAYDIQQELRRVYGDKLSLRVEIASIRDKARMDALFESLRPEIVFHTAAHKHVQLMEESPSEAIKNNIFGVYHVIRAAEKSGVGRFVMVSADLAGRCEGVVGLTARFCELVLQSRLGGAAECCAVRLGDTIDSRDSPAWQLRRQIEEGGPVTVPAGDETCSAMTLSDAAQLILEAGATARRGQVLVLDMGERVRLTDLAEKLADISERELGGELRLEPAQAPRAGTADAAPPESREELLKTENERILAEPMRRVDARRIASDLKQLDRALAVKTEDGALIELLRGMVSEAVSTAEKIDP